MQKQEEPKQIYEVLIWREDGRHITAISDMNYDKCFELWKALTKQWEEAVTKKVPFSMTVPVVTAFDPGLIREVMLRPLMKVPESKYDNPYTKKMLNEGLSNVVNKGNIINPDMLDEGYR